LALKTYAGFLGVSETLRMAGRNYGLKGMRFVLFILILAALPSILAGLKIGWAFAWRTLIAAELVFGATSGKGGLDWYIFQNRNELYTDKVFAGLAVVILIGLLVENLVFDSLERVTVKRWGVVRCSRISALRTVSLLEPLLAPLLMLLSDCPTQDHQMDSLGGLVKGT